MNFREVTSLCLSQFILNHVYTHFLNNVEFLYIHFVYSIKKSDIIVASTGHKMVLHPGDLLGYHSFLAILPDRNIGVYVAVNQNDVWDRRLIALHVLDILTRERHG